MAGGAFATVASALLLAIAFCTESGEDEQVQVQLLQLQSTLHVSPRLTFSSEPTPLLLQTKPLYWMHIPKTGSSWENVMIHTPTICPLLPAGIVVNRSTFCKTCNEWNDGMSGQFRAAYPIETTCSGGFFLLDSPTGPRAKFGNHLSVGSQWGSYQGHVVTVLRQPEQRLISSYHHEFHGWPKEQFPDPKNITAFAQVVQGCTVRTLMRDAPPADSGSSCMVGDLSKPDPLTRKDIEAAKQRVSEMSFVGIMEEWDISVCLWHAKFGGLCYGSDLANNRFQKMGQKSPEHDVAELDGFVDKIDGELYAYAKDLFWAEAERYGVSTAACQPCFDHAAQHWAP